MRFGWANLITANQYKSIIGRYMVLVIAPQMLNAKDVMNMQGLYNFVQKD
jgi:hypothetical protein